MEQNIPIITIDGPVASGKGSVSAGVAKVLGCPVGRSRHVRTNAIPARPG